MTSGFAPSCIGVPFTTGSAHKLVLISHGEQHPGLDSGVPNTALSYRLEALGHATVPPLGRVVKASFSWVGDRCPIPGFPQKPSACWSSGAGHGLEADCEALAQLRCCSYQGCPDLPSHAS